MVPRLGTAEPLDHDLIPDAGDHKFPIPGLGVPSHGEDVARPVAQPVEAVALDADEPVGPRLEACGERVEVVEPRWLYAVLGNDWVPGRDRRQLVWVEDRGALAKQPDPPLDGGQELDPSLLVERGEEAVDAGLISDPECLGEFGPRRRDAVALEMVSYRLQGAALPVAEPDRAHLFVVLA